MVKEIIGHLVKKGYTKIGFVTETITETMTNLGDRCNGYKEGLKENNIKENKEYIFIEDKLRLNKMSNGRLLMEELLKSKKRSELPEVFITSSDLVAIGMIGALKEKGYNIPEDFGIIGYDDLLISAYFDPPLTTVQQDPNLIGSAAWDITIKLLNSEITDKPHIYLNQKLIVRDSV